MAASSPLATLVQAIQRHLPGRRRFATAGLCLAMAAVVPLSAAADVFPSRPVRFVVPFAPGSITDVAARFYAKRLSELAGQPVVVENRPGANGLIGVQAVLGAPADGHTVLIGTTSPLATNVALYKKLPYDPLADFTPLTTMVSIPTILVAPKDSPLRSLQDLVRDGQARPGALNYSAGATSYHLMGELFNEVSGIVTTHIPYKGSSEALRAAVGKEVDFGILDASTALGPLNGGTVQALAVASEQRLPMLPDVPTAAESGVSGYTASTWVAAVVPASVPGAVADRLAALMTTVADEPATHAYFNGIGAAMLPSGPQALRTLQAHDIDLWKRVATRAKIELQ